MSRRRETGLPSHLTAWCSYTDATEGRVENCARLDLPAIAVESSAVSASAVSPSKSFRFFFCVRVLLIISAPFFSLYMFLSSCVLPGPPPGPTADGSCCFSSLSLPSVECLVFFLHSLCWSTSGIWVGLIEHANSRHVPLGLGLRPECMLDYVACLCSYIYLPSSYVLHTLFFVLRLFSVVLMG